ncbi:MAG TPA: hypothetical protein VMW70_14025 [Burkholderiales bacterium]|jgi:hypothetical protein|nr:hypothetical protein [Burkholderiales bacterium]
MIARLNFLFAVAFLTVLVFFFVGRFLILEGLMASAPSLAPYFTAAYALAALMLTVLVLAKTVIRLNPATSVARYRKAGLRTGFAQAILFLGHACALFALYTTFVSQPPEPASWPWLLAPVLFAAGVAVTIVDWRKRALQTA